ncbi:MAG: cobalamin-binding protein [Elusimicrobia bacterium]|nr:cobalamin-binding protein [Elusimicrobiota bacterium]
MTRVASLLPSATEMVYALGCEEMLVGVSHECDYPVAAKAKPQLVKNRFPTERMTGAEIDRAVSEAMRRGESIYELDLDKLAAAKPDVVLTQQLCDVCAVTGTDLQKALKTLGLSPILHEQTPKDVDGIFKDIVRLGELLGVRPRAETLAASLRERFMKLGSAKTSRRDIPRVYCMEWLDPPYAAGHWVPEQALAARATEVLGQRGKPSRRITWSEVARADPDAIVIAACGYDVERTLSALSEIADRPEWTSLRAVRESKVWATDANAYFSRPGPRVVDGAELLAHILHPDAWGDWKGPPDAFRKAA